MAPHSRILAWRIPWTEEPGRLESMESQRVRHDRATHFLRPENFPSHSARVNVLLSVSLCEHKTAISILQNLNFHLCFVKLCFPLLVT